ncbi:MAG: HAMP domain-containing histidine kinase [Lachnospiraceae bacterium]|nr:HAMP domain-containing histidine kinase [Lachnospiraceae bacterium]
MGLFKRRSDEKPQNQPLPEAQSGISEIALLRRMLSHNVRMPMAVISGYGDLLKKGLLNESEKEKCIENICENIFYMNQVLKIVLDDENDSSINPGSVDVVETAWKLKNYVKDIASKIPIEITINSSRPQMYAWTETIPLMKVFYQLFDNAFKYLGPGNSIQISIYDVDDNNLMIVFRDDGPGVPKEALPQLFDQGFRAPGSEKRPGTGFGLYNVKTTIEQYHGTVTATGDIDKGLSVVIMIPTKGQ